MGTATCVYHFLVLSWYVFLTDYISQPRGNPKQSHIFLNGGQWKYLTFLNLLLQAIFYGVACLEDVLRRIKGEKDIKFLTAFRDLLFTTLAFPTSTFVFLSFWILFLYDRELVFPKAVEGIFPGWFNHAVGTINDIFTPTTNTLPLTDALGTPTGAQLPYVKWINLTVLLLSSSPVFMKRKNSKVFPARTSSTPRVLSK